MRTLAVALIAIPQGFFLLRYAMRLMPFDAAFSATIAYGFVFIAALMLFPDYWKKLNTYRGFLSLGILALIALLICSALITTDGMMVDRQALIPAFWDAVCQGEYPYLARASNTGGFPGPMPVCYALMWPFYITGLYGLMPMLGFGIWLFFARGVSRRMLDLSILVLAISFLTYWEEICRSNVFFCACLFFIWFCTLRDFTEKSMGATIVSAILGGLLLSTRGVMAIPVMMFVLSSLRSGTDVKKIIVWCTVLALSFAATFLPIIATWGWSKFMEMNPFWLQTHKVTTPLTYLIILVALVHSCFLHSFRQVLAWSGFYIAMAVFALPLGLTCKSPELGRLYLFTFDFSYMLQALPFLITTLAVPEAVRRK